MEKTINKTENRENRFGFYPGLMDCRNIFVYPVPTNDYVLYVNDLDWLEDHQERLQLIRMATPDDSIRLVINSPGGVVSVAMAYVNAIAESAANIVTHAEGNVCSAGTVLWLAGTERTVSPLTVFMFHNYQGGTWGDGANMHSQILFEKEYFDRLIDRFYNGVLTEEEILRIKGGGQVWMDEVQVLERADAVLLDAKNIRRMQRGQAPISARKKEKATEENTPDPEGDKKVRLSLTLDGEKVILEALDMDEDVLAGLSTDNLIEFAIQVASIAGIDAQAEGWLTDETPREDIIEKLKAYGAKVSEKVISEQGGQ